MENQNNQPISVLYKKAAEIGLILAFIGIGINVLLYLIGMDFITQWWVGILILLVMLVLNVIFSLRIKKTATRPVITYWQALASIVIMLSVSAILSGGFQMLLTKVIDPDYNEKMQVAVIKNTVELMQNMGVPEDKVEETIDQMQKGFDEQKNGGAVQMIKGIAFTIVWFLVFGLIMAIFVRKQAPVLDNTPPIDQPTV